MENEIYIYIYLVFFFFVAGMKKKCAKKKKRCRKATGLLPKFFSKCESQYSKLYCDTRLDRQGLGDRPKHTAEAHKGRAGARIVSHDTGHDKAKGGHDTSGNARTRGLADGLCRDTSFCIMTEVRDWRLGVVSRYSLCIVTSGQSG